MGKLKSSLHDDYFDVAAAKLAEDIDRQVMEQLGWQLMLEGNPNWTLVQIPYFKRNDQNYMWNEACAWAMEQFGLPGERYITHLNDDSMNFLFKDAEDATIMTLRWV